MMADSLEERSLEVLDIPDDMDDDLLTLYFENKRRSGGGNLVSLERHGNQAFIVFEDAETAVRVLSKSHVLFNTTLTLRRKPPKDPGKLLLKGLNPHTSLDHVELFMENITRLAFETDFTLYPSPNKDLVLVHLKRPLPKDFQMLSDEVSKKSLNGAKVTLEQVESTDSVLVANLSPAHTEDVLELYFESSRGGGADVLRVSMLANGCAKVTFKDVKSVDCILQKSHNLEGTDLVVKPYFDFLHASVDPSSVSSAQDRRETLTEGIDQIDKVSSQSPTVSNPVVSTTSVHGDTTNIANTTTASATEPSIQKECVSFISVPDATKHQLLSLSKLPENLTKAHLRFDVTLAKDGVQIKGPDQIEVERLKNKVLEFLTGVVQEHLTYDELKAEFLKREDVKKRLNLSLKDIPSTFSVSDYMVTVTSSSRSAAKQAQDLIQSQIAEFTLPMAKEYESVVFSEEWSDFLVSLDFCCAKVSDTGGMINVVTLTGMEKDKKDKIVEFLSTPHQKETVLSMEPGMLQFLQLHHRDLLADMGEVILFPLETGDGLSIQGDSTVCQSATELLSAIIGSVYTRNIVVKQPGIARFLLEEEEGISILAEMTAKFEVYIDTSKVRWEPLEDNDVLELAFKMTHCQNFQRSSCANFIQESNVGVLNGHSSSDARTSARIEEAKKMLAVIGSDLNPQPSSLGSIDIESQDLYSDQNQETSAVAEDEANSPRSLQTLDLQSSSTPMNACSLDEDASLLLAIQLSMEINQSTETEDIQTALELSKRDSMPTEDNTQLERAFEMSLQDAIKSSNTAEIFVYANYNHDLVRVDIALGKKVGMRQCEEKIENKNLRKLSSHQKKCIELIKRKHAVEISIQGTTAILSGFRDYVSEAVIDLKNVLRRTENMMNDAEIVKAVQWVWYEQGSSKAIPYPPDATVFIENAWRIKQKKIDILFNNQPYSIDFEKMEEHSLASGKSVPIKRKRLSTEDLYTAATDEDYSLLSSMPEVSTVDVDSDEFQEVVKDFYDTLQDNHNKIRIIKVEKLMNKLLNDQYRLKKASIERCSSEQQVERILYHGTSETSVKEICIHGFNRSFCGKNGIMLLSMLELALLLALLIHWDLTRHISIIQMHRRLLHS
ncbi:protein mono-ADP-ribosyltransferase PARP10 isoform X2 [Pimephales promelas]|uniref:protein mono-ADP-ribosyltransferase PARP10 isoform X2 n=1 Tax=Pimephales promelas TaxID=90988 RepID=UPI001955A6DC|nr:protein mono-ADP-ribosyltransferase PARP10 isoform X2 [Pimephales promelas]